MRIDVLGRFDVLDGSHVVELPGTKVAALIKMLVVSGGSASVEKVTDFLWPGADADTGNAR